MFEISDETLKEMINIKNTCLEIECKECNYRCNYPHGDTFCNLYYPYNWEIERACGEGIISDNEKFEKLLHKCIEDGRKE